VKVLVTGGAGQLGRSLARSAPAAAQVVALDRNALDITDARALERIIDDLRPAAVLNAAAYTAVDRAESEEQRAHAVNSQAVAAMAALCAQRGIRLVHVSTDFVFDGCASRPYLPDDATSPLNVYGRSKREGEARIVGCSGLDWRIVRTAWLYDSAGHNFVTTMLRLFGERPRVTVVADQVSTPTSCAALAQCLWRATLDTGPPGILHFTDAGVASWYDFAVAIYEEARALGLLTGTVEVVPIATEQYPTAARRPAYSVLDKRATYSRLALSPTHWRANLRATLQELSP
jgi:dTDP-4-dehydrorhamnose reductase